MRLRHFKIPSAILVALIAVRCSRDPEVAKREFEKSGDAYVSQGRLSDAVVQYRSAIQKDPRFGQAHFKLAEALGKLGDLPGAYKEYNRAADLLPNSLD